VSDRLWWRIAARNLWRNPRRTLLAGGALGFGFGAAVTMVAVADGMTREMVVTGTAAVSGQIQIHAEDYLPARHTWSTIGGQDGTDVSHLLDAVSADPQVRAATPRVYGGGLLSVGDYTIAGLLMGVDPARERRVSRILAGLPDDQVPATGSHDVLIGSETARRLHAKVGSELVIVTPAADGSLGNDLYRVSGIYHTGLAELDGGLAVMPIDALQTLLALPPERIHEVALSLDDPWAASAVADSLTRLPALASLHVAVEPWNVFRPELASFATLARSTNGMLVAIVFLMAIFGVTNTLLMATFERRREFAVEGALGVSRAALARSVVYEGLLLGTFSLLAGAIVFTPLLYWWHVAPPDASRLVGNFTVSGALVRPVLRADPSLDTSLAVAAALLVTSVLAAVYPAFRTSRIAPAETLGGRQ
jgi:putative ABC transport system permease protein